MTTNGDVHDIRELTKEVRANTRFTKVEFPKFSGEDPKGWIYKSERYFKHYGTAEDEKLLLASFHLHEEAIEWFQSYETSHHGVGGLPSSSKKVRFKRGCKNIFSRKKKGSADPKLGWQEFTNALCEQFSSSKLEKSHETLAKLDIFIGGFGMKEEIKGEMGILNPTSMHAAVESAQRQEERLQKLPTGPVSPPDWSEILSRATTPVEFPSQEELFNLLCNPILIDNNTKSFSLVRTTGKKCLMLGPRELNAAWGSSSEYWKFSPCPASRFSEVLELLMVCWLQISCTVNGSVVLSSETKYGAYFVFKLNENSYGFSHPAQKASVKVREETSTKRVVLKMNQPNSIPQDLTVPNERNDGWLEFEMGEFFNGDGDTICLDFSQCEEMNWKSGLIIQGIELRPKN